MQTDNFYTDPAHVPLDQLRRYQADALPPAARHQVEKHLLDCDLCTDLLEGLEASPAPVTQRAVQDLNQRLAASLARQRQQVPFYTGIKNWGVAAAILIFMLSGTVVVYYNLQNIKSAENAAARQDIGPPPAQTIVKPTEPALAETKPALPAADSNRNDRVLAFKNPKVAGASSGQQVAIGTAPAREKDFLPEAVIPNSDAADAKEINSVAAPVPNPDTPAVVFAPKPAADVALSGKVAGVAVSKSRSSFQDNKSRALQINPNISGKVVKGQVTDDSGQGLPGVTVNVKGTPVVAVTDATGAYNVVLPEGSSEATLVFSYIGFTTTEKKVNNLNAPLALHVQMAADAKALSEVVVVGYGTQGKPETGGVLVQAKPHLGFNAYRKYIGQNLKYPVPVATGKTRGRVVVGFTVNPDGSLTDFKIIKSLSPACDAEALRLVKEGPAWEPTKKDGTAISQQVRVSIRFKPPS